MKEKKIIWGSEEFISEVFKTLYGKKWQETFQSYNDAIQKIKNLVQQQEQTNENIYH